MHCLDSNNIIFLLHLAEQEDHELILEIGLSIKFVSKHENLIKNKEDISAEDVNVSLMADLQEAQDEETRTVMDSLQQKVSISCFSTFFFLTMVCGIGFRLSNGKIGGIVTKIGFLSMKCQVSKHKQLISYLRFYPEIFYLVF